MRMMIPLLREKKRCITKVETNGDQKQAKRSQSAIYLDISEGQEFKRQKTKLKTFQVKSC